jgi:DNA-binding CsgD family transcriptional regulator
VDDHHIDDRAAVDGWASGWPVGAADELLFGREDDLGRIDAMLAGVPQCGGVLLLLGEPGVGKSALLATAGRRAAAAGVQVLHTTGMPYKAQPGYSALAQLLRPAPQSRLASASEHDGPLAVVLGGVSSASSVSSGPGPTPTSTPHPIPAPDHDDVARAVLSLFADLSRGRPTLLVVDDLQWLDRASALVLSLVARQLTGTRVGMLCAARPGAESFFDSSGLPTHDLGPLSDTASEALLVHSFPALAARVRLRLMAEAQGNPLALLELPVALTDSQRAASQALPERLPLSRRLQDTFASRVNGLPAATRHLLLIAALEGSGDLQVLRRAAAGRCDLKHLAPAEHAQLIQVDDETGRLRFRHSLTRAAVVEFSSSDQRRNAHRALADAWETAPERQAWHLARAAIAPDERIAVLLEHAATVTGRRGDGPAAVAALLRAADLSPEASARARRLAEAAYLSANLTGDLRGVPRLLEDARRAAPGTDSMATAVAGSAYLLNGSGDLDTAHRLLSGAIALAPEPYERQDTTLVEALHTLLLVCFFGGRAELWTTFDDALGRYTDPPGLLTLLRSTLADPARTAAADLAALDAAVAGLAVEDDPMRIVRIAMAAVYLDRLGGCVQPVERVAHGARTGENILPAINALFLLGTHALHTGQGERLRQVVGEGLALCEEYQCPMLAWPGKFLLAYEAAFRGDFAAAKVLTDQMDQWAGPRRAAGVRAYAAHVRGVVALTQGDFEEAYRQATLVAPAGTLPIFAPHALWVILDLVDAAVRTGRRDEAKAHAAAVQDARLALLSPRLRMLQSAVTALASDDLDHPGLADALAVAEAECWPFAMARIRLYHGERLRRAKAVGQARTYLSTAAYAFDQLGAKPWADRARQELRACGGQSPALSRPSAATLTPQQWEIARLAAAGLSNKQIGEKLFLSPRTVSTHLYQLFPKLGISSRAALRDALEHLDTPDKPDTPDAPDRSDTPDTPDTR